MDLDLSEPPRERDRERIGSSEPSSTRLNPFDDQDQSARKRQRIQSGESRSMSLDTTQPPTDATDMFTHSKLPSSQASASPEEVHTSSISHAQPPQTPPRPTADPTITEPTSSKVTINLRTPQTPRTVDPTASSPTIIPTPSETPSIEEIQPPIRMSIESESEAVSNSTMATPASSPSAVGSPQIELIPVTEDDVDFRSVSPPVAIIDDDNVFVEQEIMAQLPFHAQSEPYEATIARLARFFEYDTIENDDAYSTFGSWIETYLKATSRLKSSWYESYCQNRTFWASIPDLIWSLSHRRVFFGSFLRTNRRARRSLIEFFIQFARLAARHVQIDALRFAQRDPEATEEPDLVSRPYLLTLGHIIRKEGQDNIACSLEVHYNFNWDEEARLILNEFIRSGASIALLKALVEHLLDLVPRFPKVTELMLEPCRCVARAVADLSDILKGQMTPSDELSQQAPAMFEQGYDFYDLMNTRLMPTIEKQSTALSQDCALNFVTALSSLLFNLVRENVSRTQGIVDDLKARDPEIPSKFYATVLCNEWRFVILEKFIKSGQMQLRVTGAMTMCQDFLGIFTAHRKDDASKHPVTLHFAQMVLDYDLVDYIVGPGSHPEIILESSNIVGFLVATKTYTKAHTDAIWHAVTTSRNPRVVEAIVRMLTVITNLFEYDSLLYFLTKAEQAPLELFTAPMREFCEKLIHFTIQKAVNEKMSQIDSQPFDLVIRLIRETSVPRAEIPKVHQEIQGFATTRLRDLLHFGPDQDIRNRIYVSCIDDITSQSPSSPGSVCVLATVIRFSPEADLHVLCNSRHLTKLIIDEVEFAQAKEREGSLNAIYCGPANHARRDILSHIIIHEASTITPELGPRLWDLIVGKDSGSDHQIAWQMLINAAKKTGFQNAFVVRCFEEYLPGLDPDRYTLGALDFAREGVITWLHHHGAQVKDKDHPYESSGIEQLWRMLLAAPRESIEAPATTILVELYMDWPMTLGLGRSISHKIHMSLVNRCLEQLSSAAAKLKQFGESAADDADAMIIVPSSDLICQQERIFTRSLFLLREFLRIYQLRPEFVTPRPISPPIVDTDAVQSELMEVKYQTFDGNKSAIMKTLNIGKHDTIASFFVSLQKETGFKNYKLYHSGRVIDPEDIDLCTSLEDLNLGHGLVLVHRREGESVLGKTQSHTSTLELEIVKRFDELWGYLSMDEKMAKEIYFFLVKFPVYDKLLQALLSPDTTYQEIFPLSQPFKCLYAVYALREHIGARLQVGALSEATLVRAVSLMVNAVSDPEIFGSFTNEELRHYLALHFLETLIQFLREPVPIEGLADILPDTLVDRLLQLLGETHAKSTSQHSIQLVSRCFEAILESSLHSPALWAKFISHSKTPQLLHDLLLADPRVGLRRLVSKQISSKCTVVPSLSKLSALEYATAFWPLLLTLVPQTVDYPRQCSETFNLVLAVFRKLAEISPESLNLGDRLLQWGGLLINHDSLEELGRPESVDSIAQGLTNLLFWCASFAKASQQPLPPNEIALKLFRKHLFSDLSVPKAGSTSHVPLLNTNTRKQISDTILSLVKDDLSQYRFLFKKLNELVPYDPEDDADPYPFDVPYIFDRTRAVRSSVGYVGMKNLSNTCYLNSLFTQLFMNVSFRGFMLKAPVTEPNSAQKLLYETQKLFANMQNSLKRFVDPSGVAAAIRTWEETTIDVTIQMDVDEFYNLLFDRWESQILQSEEKRKFRSFYGGQLVQQVKSKECPHISERLEPFSAIQCDIKGKTSLQESLQAYVDGEIMEGDNKYKCSTCDRHVDAVKRACLKDIPDNLIFHLKRFDFNLRTLQRNKINDYFAFPHQIDMRPYKVDYLMDGTEESTEDIFELTGILVHSGTAESGHYYSYIRDTPIPGKVPSWIEFNDDSVTAFEPNSIEANCFGGQDFRNGALDGTYPFDKGWSAYMLFYQRSSAVVAEQQRLFQTGSLGPSKVPVSPRLANFISEENELLLRKYCLYDESHSPFVIRLLDNLRQTNKGQCSESHSLEKMALWCVLNHLDQVVSRAKDIPFFNDFIRHIRLSFQFCTACARNVLEWFIAHPEGCKNLVLKNPEMTVRSETCTMILAALVRVKRDSPSYYGVGEDFDLTDGSEVEQDCPQLFRGILQLVTRFWDIFHCNTKAWPEYFGFLNGLATLGNREAAMMIDTGFLLRALEVICADASQNQKPQYLRMLANVSKKPATKPASYDNVIALLETLLRATDLSDPTDDDAKRYPLVDDCLPFVSQSETRLLTQYWTRNNSHILTEKLLMINQNDRATQGIIRILLTWTEEDISDTIYSTLRTFIKKGLATVAAQPFLRTALTFIEVQHEALSTELIKGITSLARLMDGAEGSAFESFYRRLLNLANDKSDVFWEFVIGEIVKAAPSLLTSSEAVWRETAADFLQQNVLQYTANSEKADERNKFLVNAGRNLALNCLYHLEEQYVRKRIQVAKVMLVNILDMIDILKSWFEEASIDRPDQEFFQLYNTVLPSLRRLTVDEVDDEGSEWDEEDAFSSSEAMDNLTELDALNAGDIDPEV